MPYSYCFITSSEARIVENTQTMCEDTFKVIACLVVKGAEGGGGKGDGTSQRNILHITNSP